MLNTSEFTYRLKKVMEYYQLTASLFADKINVQRSSISHILSGRNKPSLDFILKIISEFKEVDIYWLLKGKGNFPVEKENTPSPIVSSLEFNKNSEKIIHRIVVFYSDNTFDEYKK